MCPLLATADSVVARSRSPIRVAYESRKECRKDRVRDRPKASTCAPCRVIAALACTSREVASTSTASTSDAVPTSVQKPGSSVTTERQRLASATAPTSKALGITYGGSIHRRTRTSSSGAAAPGGWESVNQSRSSA